MAGLSWEAPWDDLPAQDVHASGTGPQPRPDAVNAPRDLRKRRDLNPRSLPGRSLSRCSGAVVRAAVALASRPRPFTGDRTRRLGLPSRSPAPLPAERRPVDLAQPDRAAARGRPATRLPAVLASSAYEGPCGNPQGGRGDGAAIVLETWLPAEGDPSSVRQSNRASAPGAALRRTCLGQKCSSQAYGRMLLYRCQAIGGVVLVWP
jgi:hypothetical protein